VTLPLIATVVTIATMLASIAGTPLAARLARAAGLVDRPGGRKDHTGPIPLLGGAPVALALALPMGGGLLWLAIAGDAPPPIIGAGAGFTWSVERARALALAPANLGFHAGLAVMFATGLADDARKDTVPAWLKLLGQIAAAAIAVLSGARLDLLVWAPANALASILWIVTIANAMNFLDHADGLCASVALVATGIFAAVALPQEQYFLILALAALGGGLAGFLPWNLPRARIFLGDAGALSIGYALGALTLLESYVVRNSPGYLPALLPPIVLALPLFDMGVVVLARVRTGRPVHMGDRNHLHHRLVRLGMTPRAALATAVLATLALGAGAAALPEASPAAAAAIATQVAATMGLMALLMYFGGQATKAEADAPTSNAPKT
jgi:UDP-GlcNAc:undecaprenyl-phosphate GlcNAc-1-phosphate transferase